MRPGRGGGGGEGRGGGVLRWWTVLMVAMRAEARGCVIY